MKVWDPEVWSSAGMVVKVASKGHRIADQSRLL